VRAARRLHPAALALVTALLVVGSKAQAVGGTPVPISVLSPFTITVNLTAPPLGGGDWTEASGALPLGSTFNLVYGPCNASGTLSTNVVNGGLEVQISNGVLTGDPVGDGCQLSVNVTTSTDGPALQVIVPDIGESMTPLYFSLVRSFSNTGGITQKPLSMRGLSTQASSSIGMVVSDLGSPDDLSTGTFGSINRLSLLIHLIPNDVVGFPGDPTDALRINLTLGNPGASSTFDYTTRVEAFLPPNASPPIAAPSMTPYGRGALTALLIGGTGLMLARRKFAATQ